MADYYVREEDGTSKYVEEDSSGDYLLEVQTVNPSFIASATVVYDPILSAVYPGFIASVTAVYTPTTNPAQYLTTGIFTVPAGVPFVQVQAYAGGGGGGGADVEAGFQYGGMGGGGGAFAADTLAVTPGNTYTVTVGTHGAGGAGHVIAPGSDGTDGGDSSVVGDSASVVAKGGKGGGGGNHAGAGAGGSAAASTGSNKHSGGAGGTGSSAGSNSIGGGGGGSAGTGNDGSTGHDGIVAGNPDGVGGVGGATGGGHGGHGGVFGGSSVNDGLTSPGGGGGGAQGSGALNGGDGADGLVVVSWSLVFTDFIPSATTVYAANLPIRAPFIASATRVRTVFSVYSGLAGFGGPGNGGEIFGIQLAPNGTTQTATLGASIGVSGSALSLTGDSSLPSGSFCVTIDSEVIYVAQIALGSYRVLSRGLSNTTIATHTAGATVTWTDSYDQAIVADSGISHSFTANIGGTGSTTYPGWLICFDSSQAYIGTDRYPMHVTSVVGVFDAGAGTGGTNRLDAAQPNAVCTPAALSDDCPAALSNPARVSSDIAAGDVALVRYTNPEASILTLGPRAVTLQSWFGLKRVDATDHDVTFTDTTGYVIDTNPGTGRFAACAQATFLNPSVTGINPDDGSTSDRAVAYTSTTLTGALRFFTFGSPHYSEKGWPMACLAVRNGSGRVPLWASWDWKNFNYVYTGFGTDCTYAHFVANENGLVYGTVPIINLPGPQDITGPDAMWDDGSYYFATVWYVAIFSTPYPVIGPSIGGGVVGNPVDATAPGVVPGVGFGSGGGGGTASVTVPTAVEGGSGGGIVPPSTATGQAKFYATLV